MSNLPIQFQDKVNSPELLALLQQFGPETYADAQLINKFRDAINELHQALSPDRILSLGTETIDGNNYTYEDYSWQIGGITYLMIEPETIIIPSAAVGFKRKDISVFTSQGTIIRVPGTETDGEIVVTPEVPQGTLYFKSYDINGDTIEVDPEPPVIDGSIFKKKSESSAFVDGSLSGEKAVIQLRPQGNSFYAIASGGLVSIDGFGLDLIAGNPSAEPPYNGKDLIIQNLNAEPFDLVHDGDGMATAKFRFFNEQNLTVPPQGVVLLKYFTPYCEVVFKSWGDNRYERYEFFAQFIFLADSLWYGYMTNFATDLYSSGGSFRNDVYNGSTNVITNPRVWSHLLFYNQKVTKIKCSYEYVTSDLTCRIQYYEVDGRSNTSINNHTIAEFTIPKNTSRSGVRKILEVIPSAFTAYENGFITIAFFNNNIDCNVRGMTVYLETEEI